MNVRWLLLAATASSVAASAARAQVEAFGSIGPSNEIVAEQLADTDGDGARELLVLFRSGRMQRWRMTRSADGSGASLLSLDGELQLRDPSHALVACRDVTSAKGEEVVVADLRGAFVYAFAASGEKSPDPVLLSRNARCSLRTGFPQWSPFVQDCNGDGLLDLVVPTRQGCTPFVQRAAGAVPEFVRMEDLSLPVGANAQRGGPELDEEHEGSVVVPAIETEDLNGDGKKDLLTRDGKKRAFRMQGEDGLFSRRIEVDLAQFEDSTQKAEVALGSTAVIGDDQQIQRGDVDGDGIPDFVIAHRRKVWTFLATKDGPQFEKARTQAVADDVTGMLLLDLDEDKRSDLLAFQVQLPSVGALLLGLVKSIDIDVRAVGYRSAKDGFESLPQWRRTVTLRIPPLLSLLSKQEEIVQRFTDIVQKARPAARGAFTKVGSRDVAMANADGTQLQVFAAGTAAPELASAEGKRMLRRLLFEDPDPVFDLERIFSLLSGAIDKRQARLLGDGAEKGSAKLRDPLKWSLVRLVAADLDGDGIDEILAAYESVPGEGDQEPQRAIDAIAVAGPR